MGVLCGTIDMVLVRHEVEDRGRGCKVSNFERIRVEEISFGNGDRNGKSFNEVEDGSTRSNLERVRVEIIWVLGQNLQLANVPTFQDLVRIYVSS